ncbi:MAG TPA: hypothetical protein VKB78_04140 [Pirellulales bacterium]|nr:hypothetical protein [Pirellulales bacterium]
MRQMESLRSVGIQPLGCRSRLKPELQLLLALAIAGSFTFSAGVASAVEAREAKKPPASAKSSLDEELLKSLDAKPAEDPTETKPADAPKPQEKLAERTVEKPKAPSAKPRKLVGPIDEELMKSLGGESLDNAGEDIGQNQLTKIVRQMQVVKERLAKNNSDAATRKEQQQIAADLAALVEQLRKQCSQCQGGECKNGSKSSSGKPGSKPGRPNQTAGKSPATDTPNNPARNSTTQVRPNRCDRPDPLATNELVKKALDGLNLPEKDREQMLQAAPDEFLPNFEFSIRKYFERIVEEEADK